MKLKFLFSIIVIEYLEQSEQNFCWIFQKIYFSHPWSIFTHCRCVSHSRLSEVHFSWAFNHQNLIFSRNLPLNSCCLEANPQLCTNDVTNFWSPALTRTLNLILMLSVEEFCTGKSGLPAVFDRLCYFNNKPGNVRREQRQSCS